jgi:hypothetical protein
MSTVIAAARTTVWLMAAAALLSLTSATGVWAQQHAADTPAASTEPAAQPAAQTSSQGEQQGASSTATAPKQDSLAEAARKAREQKKDSKPAKVFTNDNLPTTGGISTVGSEEPAASSGSASDTSAATAKGGSGGDEKTWRDRFATLRHKLEQDQADLDVMQRELGVLNVQYYSDPVKGMQQGLTRDDINKKTADIDAKKQAIQADQQAIDDAEEDLRKAGGDPGWSR